MEIWVDEGKSQGEGGVGGEVDRGKIVKVLDKWNGELPTGAIAKVSLVRFQMAGLVILMAFGGSENRGKRIGSLLPLVSHLLS